MSRVLLIAADKPLPLCDRREERISVLGEYTISCFQGFYVSEHAYYRPAVDAFGYVLKPYQYELAIQAHKTDLDDLLNYLRENFICGDVVELWNLWVGDDPDCKPACYEGNLFDFDMDTLKQFLNPAQDHGVIGQCRMSITI